MSLTCSLTYNSVNQGTKRRRPERDISQISVDAGLSKYPLIITGSSIDVSSHYVV